MLLYRVMAYLWFPTSSGMATWCRDQMAQRYDVATIANPGMPEEESPVNKVVDVEDRQLYVCDLLLHEEAWAIDSVATLGDASVLAWLDEPVDEGPSYVGWHPCTHDGEGTQRCDWSMGEIIHA